jgi:predicted PolB exonuclease-like 3'-5' exonuclease
MSLLFIDIATIPDFELGARLYNLHDLSEKDIARAMFTKNRETGVDQEILEPHMRQIAALSVLLQDENDISLQTSVAPQTDEYQHLQFLTSIIEQHKPKIITWDRRTILPLVNFRCLSHGTRTPFAENSIAMDLMTDLSESEGMGSGLLNEVAVLCGFPGNEGIPDEKILTAFLEGSHESIRNNLELNIINVCLIYQRWQLVHAELDRSTFERKVQTLKEYLLKLDQTHLSNFVEAWDARQQ